MYAEAAGPLPAARRRHRPAPPGPRPLHRRPADHRDRQGDLARRQPADHGRADRRALSGVEVERLFAVARSLRDEGRALVFISHRFDEVFALCDTVTVMRDGEYVSTQADRRDHRRPDGRPDGRPRGRRPVPEDARPRSATWCSRSRACESAGTFHDVSFTVRAGEIVGLAGLVGAGRSEIARAVFGVDGYDAGSVRLLGKHVPPHNPRAAIRAGMAFVPEDRRKQGLVTEGSVARNVAGGDPPRPDPLRPAHDRAPRTGPPDRGRRSSRSRPAPSTWPPPR